MTSIYNLVGTADLLLGAIAAVISLFSANWVGVILGFAVAAHGAAWEKLEEDLKKSVVNRAD